MNNNKIADYILIILGILIIYALYTVLLGNKSDKKEIVVTPTPFVTFTPTPTPTIEPTIEPTITPSPTPEDKGENLYSDIYLKYENSLNKLNPTSNNNIIFTIKGDNNTNKDLYYEIIVNSDNNTLVYKDLNFSLLELDENNEVIKTDTINKYNTLNNRIIYQDQINTSINKKYKLQVTSDNKDKYDDIAVIVKVNTKKEELPTKAYNKVKTSINAHPNTTWVDNDGVIYFSGTNNVVNYNYVWYSGKLWRISALNTDGTMRLISESIITTITWGQSIEYNGSWVYQWLNEDFYDTLYNPKNIIVTDASWNYTMDSNTIPKKPETLPNQKIVKAPVGIPSSYEYYNATRNSSYNDNYLNLHLYWWHITPLHNKAVRGTNDSGRQDLSDRDPSRQERGIRPVIHLNKYVEFTGSGTKNDPYKVIGDINAPEYNKTLLNERISGEYVMFDNKVYRIVDTLGSNTKIIMVDYLRDKGQKIEKHIARTIYYGKSTNTQKPEWWDYYLPNVWYPTISQTYRNMVVDGIYYMGSYPLSVSYKNTLCTNSNLNTVTTKNCTKYSDANHIYVGKVGLPRIGEMFTAQQLDYEASPPTLWTITPFDDKENRIVLNTNTLWHHYTYGGFHVVHPTFYIKNSVKIIGGTGEFKSPYIISE